MSDHDTLHDDLWEEAENAVFDFCLSAGIDFSEISDTGTVENLLTNGWTLQDIADGKPKRKDYERAVSWL